MKTLNACAAALFVALLGTSPTYAQTGFCPDPTAEQKFWLDQCGGSKCRLAVAWATNCVSAMEIAKAFLSKSPDGDDSGADRFPETQPEVDSKDSLSGGRKGPSSKEQADEIVTRLSGKVYSTTAWDAGLGLARVGLQMCDDATSEASMRDAVRAKERCSLAEGNIRACLVTKEGHDDLRRQLQGLIDGGKLGSDAASYQRLARTPYPVCPTTLPSSGKTPAVALANYLKFWETKEDPEKDTQKAEQDKANNIIARCDALRRDISEAMDLNELDGAAALMGQFDSTCSGQNGTYAGLARLNRQQLEQARAAQPPTVLTRRGGNSGSALFKSAIDQAEQDERDRPAREAGERLAKARAAEAERLQKEQERLEEEQASTAARAWSEEDRRGLSDALKGLATAVDAYSKSKGRAGVSAGSASKGSLPVCTPGSTYNATKCACALGQWRGAACK